MATDNEHLRYRVSETGTVFVGHVCAVSVATLAYLVLLLLKTLAESVPGGADDHGMVSALTGDVLIFGILGAGFWIGAFVTAALPVVAAYALGRCLGLRSVLYYVACGALTGAMLTPIFVAVGPQMSWQNDNNFREDCVIWGPILIASGVCGALAFWYKTGRRPAPLGTRSEQG